MDISCSSEHTHTSIRTVRICIVILVILYTLKPCIERNVSLPTRFRWEAKNFSADLKDPTDTPTNILLKLPKAKEEEEGFYASCSTGIVK